jgi:hypothetical protein
MALVKPVVATVVPGTSTYDDHAGSTNDSNAALVQTPGLGLTTVIALDANGRLAPTTSRSIAVDTFGGAATDDLHFISLAAVPDGLEIEVELADTAHVVAVRHDSDPTGTTDAGPILLSDGRDVDDSVTLDTIYKRLRLRRRGSVFKETGRGGFPDTASTIGTAPQDFGAFEVSGMRAKIVRAAMPLTLVRAAHVGNMVQATNAGTVTLPNPNTGGWQAGDLVLWDCPASDLVFVQWDGNPPSNAFNHDRAYAPGAQGWVQVVPNIGGTALVWRLLGATKAPTIVSGIARTYAFGVATADYAVPNDTAVHTAHSINHLYGASEKWLYLCSFGLVGAGTTANNAAIASFVKNTGSDVTVGHARRPRWNSGVGRYGFVWGQTYGGTGGSATYRVDVANSATAFATTVQKPAILGLRLETGEDYAQDLGPHSDSAGSYVDVISWTKTTAADDFALIPGFELSGSGAIYADVQLLVDGVAAFPAEVVSIDGTGPHFWLAPWPVTLTAASHVFKLQVRRNSGSPSGTVTGANATVCLLKKAAFQQFNKDSSAAASTYTSGTYTAKLSDSWTLAAGYQTLVIGTAQAFSPNAAGGTSAKVRVRRNAALLQPEAVCGVRIDNSYEPSSVFYMGLLAPALATDSFDLGGASGDGASSVQVEGAALIALALA